MSDLVTVSRPQVEEQTNIIAIERNRVQSMATPETTQRDVAVYSAATGRSTSEVQSSVENGWQGALQAEVRASGRADTAMALQENLDDPELTEFIITDRIQNIRDTEIFSRFLPESMVAAQEAGITGADNLVLDRLTRLMYAADSISRAEEGMRGGLRTAGNLAEVFFDPLSLIHQRKYEELTERFEGLLQPGVSQEQFREGFDEIIAEAADQGFLSNQNRFYFGTFLDTLANGVYSPQAQAERALGWLDIFATGALDVAPLALRVGRGVSSTRRAVESTTALSGGVVTGLAGRTSGGALRDAARDSVSLVSTFRPSARRDRTVEEIYTNSVTMDSTVGTTPARRSQPSAANPTSLRGSYMSAPEHQAARRFEVASEELRYAQEVAARSGRVYDDETIVSFAREFTVQRIEHLRDVGALRVIDVDVGVDDFNNLVMIEQRGDSSGAAFKTYEDAENAARFGEEPYPQVDGTYTLMSKEGLDFDNLERLKELGYRGDIKGLMAYRAADPDQMGVGLFARLGSPGAQADQDLVVNLFKGESQVQKAMRRTVRTMSKITRGMSRRQVAEAIQAFQYMASRQQTRSMTELDFRQWFLETYDKEPTKAQVTLYLRYQERLDAELFVMSDQVYKQAVSDNTRIIRFGDEEYPVTEASVGKVPEDALIYDANRRQVVRRSELREDYTVYRTNGMKDFPENVQYVAGNSIESRGVYHSDFFVRNAGGHVSYVVNEMQLILKQDNVHTFADGSQAQGSPRAFLGARTREEADIALSEINAIQDVIEKNIPGGKNLTNQQYIDFLEDFADNSAVNTIIRANNRFNPEISSFQEFLNFARSRDINVRERFEIVGEGQTISKLDNALENPYVNSAGTYGDLARMNIMRGGRGTSRLSRFGGGTISTRGVQETLDGSYASAIARTAETAYRVRAAKGLIRAAVDSGVLSKANYDSIKKLPLRTQLQRIASGGPNNTSLLDTSGARGADETVGRKLQLDLERLMLRLEQESYVTRQWRRLARKMSNYLYNKPIVGRFSHSLDRWSADPLSAMRGWAFDAYLGMFDPSQLYVQAAQVLNIVGIAGSRGVLGAALYPAMRIMLGNGYDTVDSRVAQLLSRTLGMDAETFSDMAKMFRDSGRGIVDSNIAEMTMAEEAASNTAGTVDLQRGLLPRVMGEAGVGVQRTREAGRVFFKEGELIARISAYNTAYLEAVEQFGRRTASNTNQFERYIANREQALTQYMTSASRQGYEQLPFMQFMTYTLRVHEAIFAGTLSNSKNILTNAERARLAAVHFTMFGMAATAPTAILSNYIEAQGSTEMSEDTVRLIQRGLIDAALSYFSGSDTAISSRISSSMGIYQFIETLATDNAFTVAVGPGGQFTSNIISSSFNTLIHGLSMVGSRDTYGFRSSLVDIGRSFSSGNRMYNAITAYKLGTYYTRRDQPVIDDMTSMDAVFVAFGVPLEEIDSVYNYMGQERIMGLWRRDTANSISRMQNQAAMLLQQGRNEEAHNLYVQITEMLAALDPHEYNEVNRMIYGDGGETIRDTMLIELLQRDVEAGRQTQ